MEGTKLAAHPVGEAVPCPEPLAFLDGVQRWEVIAYAGAAPIVVATVAAAVRKREGKRFATAAESRRDIVIGRAEAIEQAGSSLDGWETRALMLEDPPHPVGDAVQARIMVERERAECELEAGKAFRRKDDGWLIVDGTLTEVPEWAADPKMLGVIKSHASLPFGGPELEAYLQLPYAHRTSLYTRTSRARAQVYSWALRLWEWEGKDLLYGLIRVEAMPESGTAARADEISRWLLHERAPISTPDMRWDRLLYGIHDVERYLKARGR